MGAARLEPWAAGTLVRGPSFRLRPSGYGGQVETALRASSGRGRLVGPVGRLKEIASILQNALACETTNQGKDRAKNGCACCLSIGRSGERRHRGAGSCPDFSR